MSTSSEVIAEADSLKDRGNELFKAHDFMHALDMYTRAIEMNPNNPVYYTNRSLCALRLEEYGVSLDDAAKAIELDPTNVKAYYRRGSAHMALGKVDEALQDLKEAARIKPTDPFIRQKLAVVEKEWKRIKFEMAIEAAEEEPASKSVRVQDMAVESTYDGPQLAEGADVTADFVRAAIAYMKSGGRLHRKFVFMILLRALELLRTTPNVVHIDVPEGREITVCGDTHGQFYDLLNIFEINGYPSDDNWYLFNGDFVDRGSWSVEVMLTMLMCKLAFPSAFYLTRGNHETRSLNRVYGFEGEVKAKYNMRVFEVFVEVFNVLPLCCVINHKVMVVHGGIPSNPSVTLDDISAIDRNREIPEGGVMSEMLWSDPSELPGLTRSKRGVGSNFGPDITREFLKTNSLELIVRSHEVKMEGYEAQHSGKCITVFSAPNYCDQMGNKGAYIRFGADCKPKFSQFDAVPHPDVKPMAYAAATNSMFA